MNYEYIVPGDQTKRFNNDQVNYPETESHQLYEDNGKNNQEINSHLGKCEEKELKSWKESLQNDKNLGLIGQNCPERSKRRSAEQMANCDRTADLREQNNKSSSKSRLLNKQQLRRKATLVVEGTETLGNWTEEEQEVELRRTKPHDQNNPIYDDLENRIQNNLSKCITTDELQDQLNLRKEMRTADFLYFSLMHPGHPARQKVELSDAETSGTFSSKKSRAFLHAIQNGVLYEEKRLHLENLRKKAYREEIGEEKLVTDCQFPIWLSNVEVSIDAVTKLAKRALELNEQLNGGKQQGWTLWDGATAITHENLEIAQGYDGNVQFKNKEVLREITAFDARISANPYMRKTIPAFLKYLEKVLYERNKAWYLELSEMQEGESLRNQTARTQGSQQFVKVLQAKLILYIAQLEIALHMQAEAGSAFEQMVQEQQLEQEKRERVKKPPVNSAYSGRFAGDFEELVSSSSSGVSREPHFVIMTEKEFSAPSRRTADDTVENQQEEMDLDDRYMPQFDTSPESFTDHQFTHYQPSSSSIEYEDSESQYTITELQSTCPSVSDISMGQNPNANILPDEEENEKMEWDDDSGYQILAAAPDPNYNPNWPIHEDEIDRQLAIDIESGEAELTIERELNKMRRRGLEKYFEDNIVVKFGSESDFGSVGNIDDGMDHDPGLPAEENIEELLNTLGPSIRSSKVDPRMIHELAQTLDFKNIYANPVDDAFQKAQYQLIFDNPQYYQPRMDFENRLLNERVCAENEALLDLEPKNDYLKWLRYTFSNELETANPFQLNPHLFDDFIIWLRQKLEQVKAYRSGQVSRLESAVRLANIELECRREKKVQVAFKNLEEELQKFVNHQLSMG